MHYKELQSRWETLCQIHILTKHYTLLAEEFGFSMKAILQPIKEQRDAYEHIIRAYTRLLEDEKQGIDYASKNLDKAIGHEYRAFFDSIDYLTIIIREKLYKDLSPYDYTSIKSVYQDYDVLKQMLVDIPIQIANFRKNKDIGNSNMLRYAKEYGDLMCKLLIHYKTVSTEILDKLPPVDDISKKYMEYPITIILDKDAMETLNNLCETKQDSRSNIVMAAISNLYSTSLDKVNNAINDVSNI